MSKNNMNIRMAKKEDAQLIIKYIKDLADYENELDQVCVTTQRLDQEMFADQGAEALIAEIDGEPVGFAFFHRSFSTFLGKQGLTLVDLYVEPQMRGKGCGKQMLAYLADLAVSSGMERLEWWVHDWNHDAAEHYRNWGAFQVPYIRVYRLCDEPLKALAEECSYKTNENEECLFETERLRILRAKETDIDDIIALESHRENRDYLWIGTYEEHKNEINDPNHELVVFQEKVSKEVVGYALIRLDYASKKWELRRIAISKKGNGFGKEVMNGFFKYAFDKLEMNRFWLDVYPDNLIGIKLYEGLGMHCDGTLRQNYKSERGYLDQIIYSMLYEEYKRREQKA
ncbi:GNAT family N-acetyltransferase [Anaerovorax sp. IOR16]|uniref:GNAT family N-acetyltransferase n=1 Tax=Anaerovorax sp. IOR16 TaxID=2773458 RepID=UPI001FD6B935|nr:GNAT family N-acetyltransferase [Anaerovorax sp. IOR16]